MKQHGIKLRSSRATQMCSINPGIVARTVKDDMSQQFPSVSPCLISSAIRIRTYLSKYKPITYGESRYREKRFASRQRFSKRKSQLCPAILKYEGGYSREHVGPILGMPATKEFVPIFGPSDPPTPNWLDLAMCPGIFHACV